MAIEIDLSGRVALVTGGARGVRVVSRARHMCMCSRGPADANCMTTTEFALGTLADEE